MKKNPIISQIKILLIILILLLLAASSQAVVWNEGVTGELHWGEMLAMGNYTLKLADFSQEETGKNVLVQLQEDDTVIARRVLRTGDSFVINDSVRVSVSKIIEGDVEDEPRAHLRLQLPATPEMSLLLVSDRDTYEGGDLIRLKLKVENRGIVDAENLRISLNSTPPLIRERFRLSGLKAGEVWDEDKDTIEVDPIKIDQYAPYLPESSDLEVRIIAEYLDPEGESHQSWGGTTFRLLGPIKLHKRVDEVMEFSDSSHVINSIRNLGNRTLTIDLYDSTGPNFITDDSLDWRVVLKPGESKTFSYRINAKKPGMGQALNDATASYRFGEKTYTVHSEIPLIDVIGPQIDVTRKINPSRVKAGEEATISYEFKNVGNRKAVVILKETVPTGVELLEGALNDSFMLSIEEKATRKIRLRFFQPGAIRIPADSVTYRDVRGNEYHTDTPALEVEVQDENEAKDALPGASGSIRSDINAKRDVESRDATDAKMDGTLLILPILVILLLSLALGRYL